MNILGFASLNHDPTVALVQDGTLTTAIESEKVTLSKHEINVFPERAIHAVLEQAAIAFCDIDPIATNYAPGFRANDPPRWFIPIWVSARTIGRSKPSWSARSLPTPDQITLPKRPPTRSKAGW